jgi:Ser/Thr protein kinase RdoA (MazF antagonist)
VHALLGHLATVAPGIAPRVLGIEGNCEILSYIPGRVPSGTEFNTVSVDAVRSTGRLLRRFHDASRSFQAAPLPDGVRWHYTSSTHGPFPVVCHNDISPRNTVFRGDDAVSFIDWDLAGPEDPRWDLAHAVWQFAPLMSDASCRLRGWSDTMPDRRERLASLLDGYGLTDTDDRTEVLRLVAKRVEATLTGIEGMIESDVPAARKLVADKVPDELRHNLAWLATFQP